MNDLVSMLLAKIMEFEPKLTTLEALFAEHKQQTQKTLEEFNKRDSQIYDLIREIKSDLGQVKGRTEKGDVNINADTNIGKLDNREGDLHVGNK